ncbi:protein-glutamine gamma-glutamyltransferase 2-like [Thalassophryne amazonica]|uniref:protein-glutamine gamma-glutamyltransferase 2-like n=1 Tax=Thalassophryne amazonica TaxID=390379 RepID=UPI0014709164|nr:protein-glutamine gamma-glutamyltransferase 2-like [Thalassophryne amazonica]
MSVCCSLHISPCLSCCCKEFQSNMIKEDKAECFFKSVEIHAKKNNTKHHTNEISTEQLVVRRGQEFRLTVEFCQPFNAQIQPLLLTAKTGECPTVEKGSLSNFAVPEDAIKQPAGAKAVWKAVEFSKIGTNTVILSITPPADCPIGKYTLSVKNPNKETDKGVDKKKKDKKGKKKEKRTNKEMEKDKEEAEEEKDEEILVESFMVLFSAWCSDDSVYLPDEAERQEYVLNESGLLYRGSWDRIHSKCWDYGQFEPLMMDICMKLLDVNPKHADDPANDVSARCNPIYISRALSRMINCDNDKGVLDGRWGGPYCPFTKPMHWNGSYEILKKWFETECQPIKYGQCWVFAGVMCSVMRALGIPCRPVTNFESAYDSNQNLIVDVFHYKDGKCEAEDSVWNFHVWVEGYMRRPDLSDDGRYDGWQVLDPTPQDTSDGVYCYGPAPVCAIRSGELDLKYDVPFIFAEVNADCIDYLVAEDGSKTTLKSNTKRVGQCLSTKAVGGDERQDITNTYKPKEGSEEERVIFKYTVKVTPAKPEEKEEEKKKEEKKEAEEEETPEAQPTNEELSIQFDDVGDPVNGQDVNLMLVLSCNNKDPMPLCINIIVKARTYCGSSRGTIQSELKQETLQPGKDLSIPIKIPYSDYRKPMQDCDSMRVSVVVKHEETNFLAEEDIELDDPPMSLTVAGELTIKQPATATVVFVNPIEETLTNCFLTMSGSVLTPGDWDWKIPDIPANNQLCATIKFHPEKAGNSKTLTAVFTCDPFEDIKATCTCKVKPAAAS